MHHVFRKQVNTKFSIRDKKAGDIYGQRQGVLLV